MAKSVIFHNTKEINSYREVILKNLSHSISAMKELFENEDASEIFRQCKFKKIAKEPISGEPENLIEVINQSQTYLVSLAAVDFLFEKYTTKSFIVNWGNASGYDIESSDGTIIAECFAATSYRSNGKLAADLKRLASNKIAKEKYEFFYALDFTEKSKRYYEKKYPDISIIRFIQI